MLTKPIVFTLKINELKTLLQTWYRKLGAISSRKYQDNQSTCRLKGLPNNEAPPLPHEPLSCPRMSPTVAEGVRFFDDQEPKALTLHKKCQPSLRLTHQVLPAVDLLNQVNKQMQVARATISLITFHSSVFPFVMYITDTCPH